MATNTTTTTTWDSGCFAETATDLTDVAAHDRLENSDEASTLCLASASTSWNAGQELAIRVVVTIAAVLSIIGASFIIITYVLHPQLRKPAYRLILALSIADLGASIMYLSGAILRTQDSVTYCPLPVCYFQAVGSQFFEVATFFWTGCIAFNIWGILVITWTPDRIMQLQKFYHVVSWGIPGILALIALFGNFLGDAGVWCWIVEEQQAARVLLYYIWLIGIIVFVIYAYGHVIVVIRGTHVNKIVARLRFYILVFLGTHIMSIVNRVQNLASPCNPIFVLFFLQAALEPLQGFFNAIVYGLNPKVLDAYKTMYADWKNPSEESENLDAGQQQMRDSLTLEQPIAEVETTADVDVEKPNNDNDHEAEL